MILGNSKKFKGIGYVCYLDVLGFSDDILRNWNKKRSNPLNRILAIKKHMPGFSDIEDDDGSDKVRRYVCRVTTISDSVTICFGYSDKIMIGDLVLGLEAILSNIAYIWGTFIVNGYTLRGSIDFGDIYWDENELVGPAFINAYQLESQVARNSRIIISSNLNNVFKDLVTKHKGGLTDHLMRSFRKDIDGYIIVDPNILYETEAERMLLIDSLRKTRDSVKNALIREKYNPLMSLLANGVRTPLNEEDIGNY